MNFKARHFSILVLFLISISFAKSSDQKCVPEQIHLSFGDKYHSISDDSAYESQLNLVWLARDHCKFNVIVTDAKDLKMTNLNISVTSTESYSYDFAEELDGTPGSYQKTSYTVLLQNLLYESLYEYKIVDSDGQVLAGPFTFTLPTPELTSKPKRIIFFGNTNNSTKGNITIQNLHSKLLKNKNDYAALVNLGSNFYQIQEGNGTRGDLFFESIENLTQTFPLVSSSGANDAYDTYNFFNFRTRNPLYKQTKNQYFSFNLEGIHFIHVNFDNFTNGSTKQQEEIISWVEKDLIQASDSKNKELHPWIVVIAQQPIYCSQNSANLSVGGKCYDQYQKMKNWDELFHKYSVDLMISGGPNSYERMSPIYKNESAKYTETPDDIKKTNVKDSNGTVYIIENTAAIQENDTDKYKIQTYGYVVDRNPGFGSLYAVKEETGELKLVYEHHNSETGQVIDTMNLVKTNASVKHKNKTPYLLMVLGMALGVVLVTGGLIALRRMKQNAEAEDNVPLTGNPNGNSPLRSNRLRYARPGEKGITMVDLVLC